MCYNSNNMNVKSNQHQLRVSEQVTVKQAINKSNTHTHARARKTCPSIEHRIWHKGLIIIKYGRVCRCQKAKRKKKRNYNNKNHKENWKQKYIKTLWSENLITCTCKKKKEREWNETKLIKIRKKEKCFKAKLTVLEQNIAKRKKKKMHCIGPKEADIYIKIY